jgi:hypothetical protein
MASPVSLPCLLVQSPWCQLACAATSASHHLQVIDPTYFQMLTQLPPLQAAEESVFVHDQLNSFTKTMLLGNDLKCFVYEALFFCTIDTLALNNVRRHSSCLDTNHVQ